LEAPPGALVHHFFAIGLIFIGLYHLAYSFWSKQQEGFYELLPSLKDFSDLFNQIKYYLGARKEKVKYGRFTMLKSLITGQFMGLIMMINLMAMWLFHRFDPRMWRNYLSFGPI
jgi:hypothetical protein